MVPLIVIECTLLRFYEGPELGERVVHKHADVKIIQGVTEKTSRKSKKTTAELPKSKENRAGFRSTCLQLARRRDCFFH